MVTLHRNKNLTKTEVGTRDWGVAMIDLTMVLFKVIQTLVWVRKAVEFFNPA